MNPALLIFLIELPLILSIMVSIQPTKVKPRIYFPSSCMAGMMEGGKNIL